MSDHGAMVVRVKDDVDPSLVMGAVDDLFMDGPQRVQTTTESEFQAQFVSMFGNIPFFVSAIGGGVLAAVLLACINTMLMAAREQRREVGVLKALGFSDAKVGSVLLMQSLFLTLVGGGMGMLLSKGIEPSVVAATSSFMPGFLIERETYLMAFIITVLAGVVAGLLPAWSTRKLTDHERHCFFLSPTFALRAAFGNFPDGPWHRCNGRRGGRGAGPAAGL